MKQNPNNLVPDDCREQWDESVLFLDAAVTESLRQIDAPKQAIHYCTNLGLYLKVPYLITYCMDDPVFRKDAMIAIGKHIIAIKLLDDAADEDTSIDSMSLVCVGMNLLQESLAELNALCPGTQINSILHIEMQRLTQSLMERRRSPGVDFPSWLARCHGYGGGFLRIYGRISGILLSNQRFVELGGRFCFGFGTIITIADDMVDYDKKSERIGNLAHLIRTGAVDIYSVDQTVRGMAYMCRQSVQDASCEKFMLETISAYADDVTNRLLPLHWKPKNEMDIS